jgi:hypothetical protein
MSSEDLERLRDSFEAREENKRVALNYMMAGVIVWNILFFNFIGTKIELRPFEQIELQLMGLNVLFFSIALPFMVYHIEGELIQALNYLIFYGLFMAVISPIYPVHKVMYIPCLLFGAGLYIMLGVSLNSLPFFLYPDRWSVTLRQLQMAQQPQSQPQPQHQQPSRPEGVLHRRTILPPSSDSTKNEADNVA